MIKLRWHCNASMQHWRKGKYRVQPKSPEENLNQGHVVHHKSHNKNAGIIMNNNNNNNNNPTRVRVLTDLLQPRLTFSSEVFQVALVHFVCIAALLLSSYCYYSFLLHVVANLIRNFLVSLHLVLLSTLPTLLQSSYGRSVYPAALLKNFNSIDVNLFLSFCLRIQISFPYRRMGKGSALYTFSLKISGPNLV